MLKVQDSNDKSMNNSSNNNSSLKIMKSEDISSELITFVNIYLENLKQNHPELEIEIKDRSEFWDEIDKNSQTYDTTLSLWPLENRDIELDEKDEEDLSVGLVYHLNNPEWRIKSPDEIDNTFDEDNIVKFEVENDFEIKFQKMDEDFDHEELSIYRVSITPLTESSIIKQISAIKKHHEQEEDDLIRFEDQNDIVFIKSNIKVFDNTQLDGDKIFFVSSPYTVYMWVGPKVEDWILKGTIAIFREFSYKIRKIPLIFFPSYMDEEQNLGTPNLQIIYKNKEGARFESLFRHWRQIKFPYLMLRTNTHYKSRGSKAVNKPRYMTVIGKASKLGDNDNKEETKQEEDDEESHVTEEDLQVFRSSTTKIHRTKQISSLVNVDVSESKRKQIEINKEIELSLEQEVMIKSMLMRYDPHQIFCNLPGDDELVGTKVAKSSIFQFEIQGSKYSKPCSDVEKGIFERSVSYFIVVHKNVKNTKSLGLNSNNTIFLWRGEDGLNITKNAIEKFITTPFKEIKLQAGSPRDPRNTKKGSVMVSGPSALMKRNTSNYSKVETMGVGGITKNKHVS